MKPGTRQHAVLADHTYDREGDLALRARRNETVDLDGVAYNLLKHVDNPRTGYQGTVYQQLDTGAIVVAHRGTEFDREPFRDGLADAGMAMARHNVQIKDAVELTRWAVDQSRSEDVVGTYGHAPEVTVTGHSLGGTLAQATAHHFGLRGETFNAYGAASLDRRIPEGGHDVLNHVMATDPVSAASPHYGQVRVYALPEEIGRLRAGGYHDNRILDAVTPDLTLVVAARSFGAHSMHNFLDVDGQGRPDVSVVRNPATQWLAGEHARLIDNYRDDMNDIRRGVTIGSRGGAGLIRDGVDAIRGPLPAGEPAAREAREGASASAPGERLDKLIVGEVDPVVRAQWDHDVAEHRERHAQAQVNHMPARQAAQMELGG
ncbi:MULTISPECIES: DUF6792 domain-containing protein [unclassified Luteimonas]